MNSSSILIIDIYCSFCRNIYCINVTAASAIQINFLIFSAFSFNADIVLTITGYYFQTRVFQFNLNVIIFCCTVNSCCCFL